MYGALARDGISCAVCHRIAARQAPPGVTPARVFPRRFDHGPIPGRARRTRSSVPTGTTKSRHTPWPTPSGSRRRTSPYMKSSRMCGSCHTIDLPVVDGEPGQHSLEQVTYLEWLNSGYQNEFGRRGHNAQDVPGLPHAGPLSQREEGHRRRPARAERSPSSRTRDYPEAEHRAPEGEIVIRRAHRVQAPRIPGHERLPAGDVPAVQRRPRGAQDDYMSGSRTDLPDTIDNIARQAQRANGDDCAFRRSAGGPRSIEAQVAITNLAGHRFPSGVGFRRAFIELLVFDVARGASELVWASGRTNRLGRHRRRRRPACSRRSSSPSTWIQPGARRSSISSRTTR